MSCPSFFRVWSLRVQSIARGKGVPLAQTGAAEHNCCVCFWVGVHSGVCSWGVSKTYAANVCVRLGARLTRFDVTNC